MRTLLDNLTAAAVLAIAAPSFAASFDCAKAGTLVEKTICTQPGLSKQDETIAQTYKQLLVSVGAPWDEKVKQSQREWLKTRNDDASSAAPGKEMTEALQTAFNNRLKALNSAVTTHNGLRFLTVNRVALHRIDRSVVSPDSPAAQQKYTRQERSPVYLIIDVPGAAAFNALMDQEFALPKAPVEGSSEETSTGASLNFASPELVSLNIGSYYYGIGAAHPMSGSTQLNYVLGESRKLKASDLFSSPAHANVITRHVMQSFKTQEMEPLASPAEIRHYVLDPQHWALSAKGLEVVIAQDSLFPHAAGSPEVKVLPWAAFKGQLTPWAVQALTQRP